MERDMAGGQELYRRFILDVFRRGNIIEVMMIYQDYPFKETGQGRLYDYESMETDLIIRNPK
jgi:hypothetical protein